MDYMKSPPEAGRPPLESILQEWQENNRERERWRDVLVRLAFKCGFTKMEIHQLTGLARNTIDSILASQQRGTTNGQGHGRDQDRTSNPATPD